MIDGIFNDENPSTDIATGRIIVAAPANGYGFLQRTAQLIIAIGNGRAYTVILGRMTQVPLSGTIGRWAELSGKPHVFFQGGISCRES